MLKETTRAAEFLVSEANGDRSRDQITVAGGDMHKAGTVMGRSTATGKYAALNPNSTAGYENAAGVLYDNVDATAGDTRAVIIGRDAVVVRRALAFADDVDQAAQDAAIAQLAERGVVAR